LKLFYDDLNSIVDYTFEKSVNKDAANRLIDDVESAIYKRLMNPKSFEIFKSAKNRKHDYYRIYVKNYIIFYVVIDDVMEVRRILNNRRDWQVFL